MPRWTKTLPVAALALGLAAGTAQADPLKNLERERARTVRTMLDPALTPEQRRDKLTIARHRLVDLERMVLRDDSLKGRNTPVVRTAFADADLTFLVHAAAEQDRTLTDQWLARVGVSTDSLMATRIGRR